MKIITQINKESMSNLRPGDTVTVAIKTTMKVKERRQGFPPRPHDLKFEGFYGIYSYSDQGRLNSENIFPLDIVAIHKAPALPAIPEGFTRWDGGEHPPREVINNRIEVFFRGDRENEIADPPNYYRWYHMNNDNDIIAYRIISQPYPKLKGEIWTVVIRNHKGSIQHHSFPFQDTAVGFAKDTSTTVLAIFNPFLTGGAWTEGDGLKDLEGKEDEL